MLKVPVGIYKYDVNISETVFSTYGFDYDRSSHVVHALHV